MTDQPDRGSSTADTTAREHFKDWQAVFDFQQISQGTPLRVGGQYFLDMRCGGASLKVAVPQGINPSVLLLEIVTTGDGDGGWEPVQGRFPAKSKQYDSVEVHDADGNRTSIDVEELNIL